ncbi:MAG: cytochrome c [Rubricoccaceae bacterium]|nr:cytochrome c [Rubricoccaceae bacterium]
MTHPRTSVLALALMVGLAACGGGGEDSTDETAVTNDTNSSVAASPDLPIQSPMDLGPVDASLAALGEEDFTTRCTTCHKMDERYVGPPLGDVMNRRSPEWIMNMILAPDKMIVTDPDAQALLGEYSVPMTNQNLTHDEARAILEYLRQVAESPQAQ